MKTKNFPMKVLRRRARAQHRANGTPVPLHLDYHPTDIRFRIGAKARREITGR